MSCRDPLPSDGVDLDALAVTIARQIRRRLACVPGETEHEFNSSDEVSVASTPEEMLVPGSMVSNQLPADHETIVVPADASDPPSEADVAARIQNEETMGAEAEGIAVLRGESPDAPAMLPDSALGAAVAPISSPIEPSSDKPETAGIDGPTVELDSESSTSLEHTSVLPTSLPRGELLAESARPSEEAARECSEEGGQAIETATICLEPNAECARELFSQQGEAVDGLPGSGEALEAPEELDPATSLELPADRGDACERSEAICSTLAAAASVSFEDEIWPSKAEEGPGEHPDGLGAGTEAAEPLAAADDLTAGEATPLGRPRGANIWSLAPTSLLSAYRCDVCGATWLHACICCSRPVQLGSTPYYVASVSRPCVAPPEFSVIMLTKNNLALTQVAVESLRCARGAHSVEFIFVDSGSTDGSLNYFRALATSEAVKLIVTHPDEPFLYSRNCNRGAEVARGRFLLFANNDIEVRDTDLFPKLARGLSDARVGVIGTRTDYECGNELQERDRLIGECVWSAKPVMGFLWGVRAEVFGELGGMDVQFEDYGCDEIDFEYRAIQRNYRIAVVDSLVHHEVHATFGPHIIPSLTRNIERFNAKHGRRLIQGGEWYVPFLSHSYPRVSVAIACRNHGRYLARALDSVFASYLPSGVRLQVVAVNDASIDDTAGVLEQYRLRYPEQLNVIHRHISHGPAMAKNQAIGRCIGDCVALLDADDEYLEYKLWRCLETLEGTGVDFVFHDFAFVFPDGRHERRALGDWSLQRWQSGECFSIPPSTWMFRNGQVQFCERFVTGEDPEFLQRRWSTLNPVHLPEVLTRYHVHGDSLSQRAMCRVVTGQLRGREFADVGGCTDVPALPFG